MVCGLYLFLQDRHRGQSDYPKSTSYVSSTGKLTSCCIVSRRVVLCIAGLVILQGDAPHMVEPTGFYVSTDDIHDDSKWSDAVYFEELGFDQDVSQISQLYCTRSARHSWSEHSSDHDHDTLRVDARRSCSTTTIGLTSPALDST